MICLVTIFGENRNMPRFQVEVKKEENLQIIKYKYEKLAENFKKEKEKRDT